MASEKALQTKKEIVKQLSDELKSAQSIVIADYRGLTVEQDTILRSDARDGQVVYKVAKNTMLAFAAKDAGMDYLLPLFVGPTALAYSTDDAIAPAKVLQKHADKIKAFEIKGGAMDGAFVSPEEIKALALIPPQEVLYGQVVAALASPITGLAMILQAIADKGQEAGTENVAELATVAAATEAAKEVAEEAPAE